MSEIEHIRASLGYMLPDPTAEQRRAMQVNEFLNSVEERLQRGEACDARTMEAYRAALKEVKRGEIKGKL
jgi:hypothetical protein